MLVDDLLDDGYQSVMVLELSGHALDVAKDRLGRRAAGCFEPGSCRFCRDGESARTVE